MAAIAEIRPAENNNPPGHRSVVLGKFEEHCSVLTACLQAMRREELLCDVILAVEGKTIPAHRVVLAACSDYFLSVFTSEEAAEGTEELRQDTTIHEVTNVNYDAVHKIVAMMYSGELALSPETIEDLLQAAHTLQVAKATDFCVQYLQTQVDKETCLQFLTIADKFELPDLDRRYILRHIHENFFDVSKTEDFINLDSETVQEILSSDRLVVSTEKEVFEAGRRWLAHNEERYEHAEAVLGRVRFSFMSQEDLLQAVCENVLTANPGVMAVVQDVVESRLHQSNGTSVSHLAETPRGAPVRKLVILGEGHEDIPRVYQTCRYYEQKWDEWVDLSSMPPGTVARHAVAMVSHALYVLTDLKDRHELYRYDLGVKGWRQLAGPEHRRSGYALSAWREHLFLIAGRCVVTTAVEEYVPKDNKWKSITGFPTEVYDHAATAGPDNQLYVTGGAVAQPAGIFDSGPAKSASKRWVYSCPGPGEPWEREANMNAPRARHVMQVLGNGMYVFGGHASKGNGDVERFDVTSRQWSLVTKQRVLTGLSPHGAVAMDHRIYVALKGENDSKGVVYEFDPETERWDTHCKLPWDVRGVGLCALDVPQWLLKRKFKIT
ncbi:kelch-like protein 13 [Branchiostoma lanceolatum]|uniref:kelch-like protein 13 n=1 Tax=Branchiostoma lanceolatum TaxID=7740 RepID=UPI003454C78E